MCFDYRKCLEVRLQRRLDFDKTAHVINHILTHCFVLDWSALGFGICPLGRIALSRGDAVPHMPLFLSHDAYL